MCTRTPITELTGSRGSQCFSGWGPWLGQKGREKWSRLHERGEMAMNLQADPLQAGVAKEDGPLGQTWAKLWLRHTGKNRKGVGEEMCLLL